MTTQLARTFLALSLLLIPMRSFSQVAFPGAMGFGTDTRGAYTLYENTGLPEDLPTIYHVTRLDNAGEGTYRAALEASGPRIVVFDTGGVVHLTSDVRIRHPYVTIAGQTAPGDGICISGAPTLVLTHDVIVRGVRSRPGDDPSGSDPGERDAWNIGQADPWPYNIVIDHCSFSWAIDETVNITGPSHHVTFSYNIISEALSLSIHPERDEDGHSKGFHMMAGPEDYTLHHNLHASIVGRNFLIGGRYTRREWNAPTRIELINNIVYNHVGGLLKPNINLGCTLDGGDTRPQLLHYLGNVVRRGPNTRVSYGLELARTGQILPTSQLYLQGNISESRPTDIEEEWDFVSSGIIENHRSISPVFTSSGVTVTSFEVAIEDITAQVGAFPRDAPDRRIIEEFLENQGSIKNCVEQDSGNLNCDEEGEFVPGGYPNYDPGIPPTDTDRDGIPDVWEVENGLDASDPIDAHEYGPNRHTRLEDYINSFFGSVYADGDGDSDADGDGDSDADGDGDSDADGDGDSDADGDGDSDAYGDFDGGNDGDVDSDFEDDDSNAKGCSCSVEGTTNASDHLLLAVVAMALLRTTGRWTIRDKSKREH